MSLGVVETCAVFNLSFDLSDNHAVSAVFLTTLHGQKREFSSLSKMKLAINGRRRNQIHDRGFMLDVGGMARR